jgi:hypothetical protein
MLMGWRRGEGDAGGGGRDPFQNEGGYQHKVGASIEDIATAPPSERCDGRLLRVDPPRGLGCSGDVQATRCYRDRTILLASPIAVLNC